jgi:hypothetical protein
MAMTAIPCFLEFSIMGSIDGSSGKSQMEAPLHQGKRILISEQMEQVVIVPTGFESFSVDTAF